MLLMHFFCFAIHVSLLGKGVNLYLNKNESPYPRMLYAKFGFNGLCGTGEDFQLFSMYFKYFAIISPW